MGLGQHLASRAGVDRSEAAAWSASDEGRQFVRRSSDGLVPRLDRGRHRRGRRPRSGGADDRVLHRRRGLMHAFDVLGDPVRRRILELLAEGERSSGDVVDRRRSASSASPSPRSRSTCACCGTAASRRSGPTARAGSTPSRRRRSERSTSGSTASAASGSRASTPSRPRSPAASASAGADAAARRHGRATWRAQASMAEREGFEPSRCSRT